MRRILTKRRMLASGAAVVMAVGIGTAAFAYFTATGSGTGSGTGGSATSLTIALDGTITGLVPNGTPTAIPFTVTNPGHGSEFVNTVTVSIDTFTKTVGSHPACTQADFSIVNGTQTLGQNIPGTDAAPTPNTYDWTVLAGNTATIQLVDNSADQDSCIGVTVPLTFTSN